jgi:hypothetical protein
LGLGILGAIIGQYQASAQREVEAKTEADRRAKLTPDQRQLEDRDKAAAAASKAKLAAEREAAFQRALTVARAVKLSANDPASVEFIDAVVTEAGTVALTFRAKNAFGALVVNRAVVTSDGKQATGTEDTVASLWNRYVAGKTVHNVTSPIRGAM